MASWEVIGQIRESGMPARRVIDAKTRDAAMLAASRTGIDVDTVEPYDPDPTDAIPQRPRGRKQDDGSIVSTIAATMGVLLVLGGLVSCGMAADDGDDAGRIVGSLTFLSGLVCWAINSLSLIAKRLRMIHEDLIDPHPPRGSVE